MLLALNYKTLQNDSGIHKIEFILMHLLAKNYLKLFRAKQMLRFPNFYSYTYESLLYWNSIFLREMLVKVMQAKGTKTFFFFLESNMMQNLMYWIPILL